MMKIRILSHFAVLLAVAVAAVATTQAPSAYAQDADPISTENITRDPAIPVMGNPKGDITIVEYFDYNCPYCKKVNPVLHKIARDDGRVRLIFKDWPIFGGASVTAARLALAAKYQNKYAEAHEALISAKTKLSEANIPTVLEEAGIDVERAKRDLAARGKEIDALLARNNEQATALQFQGTPAFIVGKFRVPGALDEANFKKAIAESRAAAKKE